MSEGVGESGTAATFAKTENNEMNEKKLEDQRMAYERIIGMAMDR